MTIDLVTRSKIRRLFYADHFTINAISEAIGVHHETVKRAINYEGFHKKREVGKELDKYRSIIEGKLELYPRLPATRVFEDLKGRGYKGSIESVRRFVRGIRPRFREAFMARHLLAGDEAQVDWGHFGSLPVAGGERKLYLFLMVMSFSRALYGRFTFDMKTSTFLRCHVEAFRYFNGVGRVILYDNLKSVVLERSGDAIHFNPQILELSSYYHFEPRPCNVYRGNEKGRVERLIRYVRENFFVGTNTREIGKLNKEFDTWRDQIANVRPWTENRAFTVAQKMNEERPHLLSLPSEDFCADEELVIRSGKTPFIRFDRNDYSIPPELVRVPLMIRATDEIVRVFNGEKVVCEHGRSYDKKQRIEDQSHRQALLERKRKSFAMAFREDLVRQVPALEETIRSLIERGEPIRGCLQRMGELRDQYGLDMFCRAVCEANRRGTPRPESIAHVLQHIERAAQAKPMIPLSLPNRPGVHDLTVKSHDLNIYDDL